MPMQPQCAASDWLAVDSTNQNAGWGDGFEEVLIGSGSPNYALPSKFVTVFEDKIH